MPHLVGDTKRAYQREWYARRSVDEKQRILDVKRERRQRLRQWQWDYLLAHPCVDCGETDPVVLEFDHVRGEKKIDLANAIRRGWSLVRIEVEIAKCEVVCANCHRRRTARVAGWYEYIE